MYLVSRTETFAKLFFIVSFTGLFMYVALAFYSFHTAYTTVSQIGRDQDHSYRHMDASERFEKDLKYILLWTIKGGPKEYTINLEGQSPFIENDCPEINCYITTNKTILYNDHTNFDAIVFNISLLWNWKSSYLPKERTPRQKYVFYGMEASDNHPVCNIILDNFFNWTWSYKLHSDIYTPFIEVRDLNGKVVGPSRNVVWRNDVKGTKNSMKNVTKTKAVVWIMDKCDIISYKMLSIMKLRRALRQHNLVLDIYGCGHFKCPQEGCSEMLQRDYYFYLAIEGSVSEDYVTAEVLKAYDNDVVPIVVGGADYTKFLPDNSYINYQYYTEEKLAAFLDYTIRNPSLYNEYFTWKKYYTINKAKSFNGYCQLCKLLNDKNKSTSFSAYEEFRKWWYYGSLKEKCMPKGAETYIDLLSYLNESNRTR